MIPDPELRELFKIEFEENIQILNSELLKLEQNNSDSEAAGRMMRVAHTMKGSARMIGLSGVVTLSHFFEDMLGAVKGGQAQLSRVDFNRMYRALDIIKDLVVEAVAGKPLDYDLNAETEKILNPPEPATGPAAVDAKNEMPDNTAPVEDQPATDKNDPAPNGFTIDSIRVQASKLDTLMNLSAELTISKIQLALRARSIEVLGEMLEDSVRDIREIESILRSLERSGETVVSGQSAITTRLLERFGKAHQEMTAITDNFAEDNSRIGFVSHQFEDIIRNLRMLPLSNVFTLFPRMVRDIASEMGKNVDFTTTGGNITADKKILEEIRDPLMHMIRNAVDHGIESPEGRMSSGKPAQGKITLSATQAASNIRIVLEDDGKGLDDEAIKAAAIKKGIISPADAEKLSPQQLHRLIFSPGFSTSKMITDVSGRGVGMEVVQANIEKLKGRISIESTKGSGTRFIIDLPLSLATIRVMIASVSGYPCAVPADFIETTILVDRESIFTMEGKDTIIHAGEPLSIVSLSALLGTGRRTPENLNVNSSRIECIIIESQGERVAFVVDRLLDEQEVLIKPLGMMLKNVRNVSGSTILGSGEVCMILDPNDLLRSVSSVHSGAGASLIETKETAVKKNILLVEDSITTRTQEKRILEANGYEVVTAVDGLDGLQKLLAGEFDAVVSDVEMPNMDGLTMTENIRKEKKYSNIPIVLVTSLSTDEQKKRGLDAGANAYITKSGFDQSILIETIHRLI